VELRAGAGAQFDREVVDAFVSVAKKGELLPPESVEGRAQQDGRV